MAKNTYIFDIDNTIALRGDRNPFNLTTVIKDKTIHQTITILKLLVEDNLILIFTSRSESCREDTEKWLEKKNIVFDELLMRKNEDSRESSLVKEDMYNSIKKFYNIIGVFEDDQSVIDMFSEYGIFCFNVKQTKYYKNFYK